jgi:energy-converting hydrogenase B subunit Q
MALFGFRVVALDRTALLRDLSGCLAAMGANIVSVDVNTGVQAEIYLEASGVFEPTVIQRELEAIDGVRSVAIATSVTEVFGKRVIVIGGGAQVAQVVSGAVSEADRHNIRGEHISVDTIPLVGEAKLAAAVRSVARLPRAAILVLAGSLMGGEIARAVQELQQDCGIPVISLAMAGSVPDVDDLVVSDPVQAGVMAVMAIAETASFDLARVKGKRF